MEWWKSEMEYWNGQNYWSSTMKVCWERKVQHHIRRSSSSLYCWPLPSFVISKVSRDFKQIWHYTYDIISAIKYQMHNRWPCRHPMWNHMLQSSSLDWIHSDHDQSSQHTSLLQCCLYTSLHTQHTEHASWYLGGHTNTAAILGGAGGGRSLFL